MAIDATHQQYKDNVSKWKMIDDVINLTNLDDYLIELNPIDTSEANKKRNEAYKKRAVFYAITQHTLDGLIGIMFSKQPKFKVPTSLEYLEKNIDGGGKSIYQQSQAVAMDVVPKSRAALMVTFPQVSGPISKADVVSGKYVATISHLKPSRILNWKTKSFGAVNKLVLVAISDTRVETVDYVDKEIPIIRELYLDETDNYIYKERIWEKDDKQTWIAGEEYVPKDSAGAPFTTIPFQFIGGRDNDPDVDSPSMLGHATLNIAHFRNSADYEDNVWFCGQSQPWMSGIDQNHIDLMKKNSMYFGSREMMAVPSGESMGIESAPPNPLVRQAMLDKIDLMVGIGARMIAPGGVAKTAEQSSNEKAIQHSPLSVVAENISEAYEQCFIWAGKYMGVDLSESNDNEEFEYNINTDFMESKATPQELKEIIVGFIAGTVPLGDYVRYMMNYGVFDEDKDLETYAEELGAVNNG